jgi:hypothetical protein
MPLEYSIMWHFECIEFGPSKPKYLDSHLKKSGLAKGTFYAFFLRFCHRISSWFAIAVNGTKAF